MEETMGGDTNVQGRQEPPKQQQNPPKGSNANGPIRQRTGPRDALVDEVRKTHGYDDQKQVVTPNVEPQVDEDERLTLGDPSAYNARDTPLLQKFFQRAVEIFNAFDEGKVESRAAMIAALRELVHVYGCTEFGPRALAVLRQSRSTEVFHACMDYLEFIYEAGVTPVDAHLVLADLAQWRKSGDAKVRLRLEAFVMAHLSHRAEAGELDEMKARGHRHGAIERDAADKAARGLEGTERSSVAPVVLGKTVYWDRARQEALTTEPYALETLVAGLWTGADKAGGALVVSIDDGPPTALAAAPRRLVLPGQRVRLLRDGADAKGDKTPAPVGIRAALEATISDEMELERQTATAAFGQTAAGLKGEREARSAEERLAVGQVCELGAGKNAQGEDRQLHAKAIPLMLPGDCAERHLFVYDLFASANAGVVVEGKAKSQERELVAHHTKLVADGVIEAASWRRVLSFDVVPPKQLDAWLGEQKQQDAERSRQAIDRQYALSNADPKALLQLSPAVLACASEAQRVRLVERMATSGLDPQSTLLLMADLGSTGFPALLSHLVQTGHLGAAMAFLGEQPAIALLMSQLAGECGFFSGTTHTQVDYGDDGVSRLKTVQDPVRIQVAGKDDYGAKEVGGAWLKAVPVSRGMADDLIDQVQMVHDEFRANTKAGRQNLAGGVANGVMDFFVQSGIDLSRMVAHPQQTAQALGVLLQHPSLAIEGMKQALAAEWEAIAEAHAQGEATGDWAKYHTLIGKNSAAIATVIQGLSKLPAMAKGLVQVGKGTINLGKEVLRLGPRGIARLMRELLATSNTSRNVVGVAKRGKLDAAKVEAMAAKLEEILEAGKKRAADAVAGKKKFDPVEHFTYELDATQHKAALAQMSFEDAKALVARLGPKATPEMRSALMRQYGRASVKGHLEIEHAMGQVAWSKDSTEFLTQLYDNGFFSSASEYTVMLSEAPDELIELLRMSVTKGGFTHAQSVFQSKIAHRLKASTGSKYRGLRGQVQEDGIDGVTRIRAEAEAQSKARMLEKKGKAKLEKNAPDAKKDAKQKAKNKHDKKADPDAQEDVAAQVDDKGVKKIKKTAVVAYGDTDVRIGSAGQGEKVLIQERVVGVSGEETTTGVKLPDERAFSQHVKSVGGKDRGHDGEAKVIESIEARIRASGASPGQIRGHVRVFSEIPCCASCRAVIAAFRRKYPNLIVTVHTGF